MKYALIVILTLLTSSTYAFKETNDTTSTDSEIENLKAKVDSLEIALEKFNIEMLERNPIISGKYISWGKGLTFTVEYPIASIDIGYTFKIFRGTTRLGISTGYNYRHGIDEEKTGLSGMSKHFAHLKLMAGTPVFFNLMSISAGVSQLYALDDHSISDEKSILTCTKLNFDFEFWIQPELMLFFGLNTFLYDLIAENDTDLNYDIGDYNSDTFKVGVRYYLGSRKEKRRSKKVEN